MAQPPLSEWVLPFGYAPAGTADVVPSAGAMATPAGAGCVVTVAVDSVVPDGTLASRCCSRSGQRDTAWLRPAAGVEVRLVVLLHRVIQLAQALLGRLRPRGPVTSIAETLWGTPTCRHNGHIFFIAGSQRSSSVEAEARWFGQGHQADDKQLSHTEHRKTIAHIEGHG